MSGPHDRKGTSSGSWSERETERQVDKLRKKEQESSSSHSKGNLILKLDYF